MVDHRTAPAVEQSESGEHMRDPLGAMVETQKPKATHAFQVRAVLCFECDDLIDFHQVAAAPVPHRADDSLTQLVHDSPQYAGFEGPNVDPALPMHNAMLHQECEDQDWAPKQVSTSPSMPASCSSGL